MYLDYSVSSGPFLRSSRRFEFLSEMFDHLVCENRDPSLTISASASFFDTSNYLHTLLALEFTQKNTDIRNTDSKSTSKISVNVYIQIKSKFIDHKY